MRAIITGACGFAGGHLARHLRIEGDEVLGGVIRPRSDSACETVPLDVTNEAQVFEVFRDFQPDAVYHLAGITFVPDAEADFQNALKVNVAGTYNVFRSCERLDRKVSVLLVSSAEVYGKVRTEDLPIHEDVPLRPANNYSLSKVMAEAVPLRFRHAAHVSPVIARPFNHIGPEQGDSFVTSSFARQLVQIRRGKIAPVLRVGNLSAYRDFSDVEDVVRGYRLAVLRGGGPYNFCSGNAVSIRSILDTLIELSGVKVSVEVDPARFRPVDAPEIMGSFARAQRELGWQPNVPLRESLQRVLQYWEGREA